MKKDNHVFDLLFAGLGTSAALLIHSLEKRKLLQGKKIAILDPVDQEFVIKNYCFWSLPDDTVLYDHNRSIDKHWGHVNAAGVAQSLKPFAYHHVNGSRLIASAKEILKNHDSTWIKEPVLKVQAGEAGIICQSLNNTWSAEMVLDSRPPEFNKLKSPQSFIWQTFRGWVIETKEVVQDHQSFTMMDLAIEQDNGLQFMYILPLEGSRALVEVTRFAKDHIDESRAEELLKEYVSGLTSNYTIIEIEKGAIPMCNAPVAQSNNPNHLYLGTRSGAVKPSTGYAFKRMYDHAELVAESFSQKSGDTPSPSTPIHPGSAAAIRTRFGFYDSLLLILLSRWPEFGKPIFEALYRKIGIVTILKFLDQKTNLYQDLKIFSSLPFWPFIKALGWREWQILRKCRTEWSIVLAAMVFIALFMMNAEVADKLSSAALLAGLLAIGIPHGAVDHLLETGNFNERIKPGFVIKYLIQSVSMVALWWISPIAALLLFLIYSAWHFGQADLEEMTASWNIKPYTLYAWGQGILTLLILLLSHRNDVNLILWEYGIAGMPEPSEKLIWPFVAGLITISILTRSYKGLLGTFLIVLTMWLPLMTAFGLFFIGQHSLRSWRHIRNNMGVSNWELFRKSILFHSGAWVILLIIWISAAWWPPVAGVKIGWPALLFIFLSALSFPHVLAMHRFYSRSPIN